LKNHAIVAAKRIQLSFYDALIVASAIGGGCDVLYSEDMQYGRSISGLAIVDPFLESGA
jgi:predicted nucleic acid-binding protein